MGGAGEGDGLGLGLGEGDRRSLISRITPMTLRKAMVSVAGSHKGIKQAGMRGSMGRHTGRALAYKQLPVQAH